MPTTLLSQLSATIKKLTQTQTPPPHTAPTLEPQFTAHLLQTLHYSPDYFTNLHPRLAVLPSKNKKRHTHAAELSTTFDIAFNPHALSTSSPPASTPPHTPLDIWRISITLSPSATFPYTHPYATLCPIHIPCLIDLLPNHPLCSSDPLENPSSIPLPLPNSPMTTSTALDIIPSQTLAILHSLYQLHLSPEYVATPHNPQSTPTYLA